MLALGARKSEIVEVEVEVEVEVAVH